MNVLYLWSVVHNQVDILSFMDNHRNIDFFHQLELFSSWLHLFLPSFFKCITWLFDSHFSFLWWKCGIFFLGAFLFWFKVLCLGALNL